MSQCAEIKLSPEEEQTLRRWTAAGTTENRLVERANVVLLLGQGKTNLEVADILKTRSARVSKWRRRFSSQRLEGLQDADRAGRPATYDETTVKKVLTLLDEPPPDGYGKWSGPLVAQALGDVSDAQVWRILREYQISLTRKRSWCISTDPDFGPKAVDIVGLYLNPQENALVLWWTKSPRSRPWRGRRAGCGYPTERR